MGFLPENKHLFNKSLGGLWYLIGKENNLWLWEVK